MPDLRSQQPANLDNDAGTMPPLESMRPLLYVEPFATGPTPSHQPDPEATGDGTAAVPRPAVPMATSLAAGAAGFLLLGPAGWGLARAVVAAGGDVVGKTAPARSPPKADLTASPSDSFEAARRLHNAAALSVITLQVALRCGLTFPPGHPLPGRYYRVHPLRSRAMEYIPLTSYDALLYSEREAELIRLLTDLGAIRISIGESSQKRRAAGAGIGVDAGPVLEAKLTAGGDSADVASGRRLLELQGRIWSDVCTVKEADYQWLGFEPSWRALLHARLVGRCTSASIEIARDTSFSLAAEASLSGELLAALGAAGAEAHARYDRSSEERSRFEVVFAPV